jgi:RNA polymerase sigma-70 factor (ECF subfamily)
MSTDAAYLAEVLWCLDSGEPGGFSGDRVAERHAERHSELLVRIRRDDAAAFDELISLLAQPLVLYARRFSASIDDAQDLVQDVFLWVWEQRHALEVRGSLRAYLYTAVRHRAFDVRKRNDAEAARITAVHADGGVPAMGHGAAMADSALERHEIASRLAAAFATLPPRAREVALLRWQDGLSHAEIAAVMGIALGTVKNHLTLATQMTRALLEDLRDSD